MTIEEINALTVQDVEFELLARLGLEENPNDGSLEAELDVYKVELIAIENERLRKIEWYSQIEAIKDLRAVLNDLSLQPSNMAIYCRDIVENNNSLEFQALIDQSPITEARLDADKAAKDADKAAKDLAKDKIKVIDWSKVDDINKLKDIVKDLVDLVK